jgi:acetyl esterase/lipase
MTKPTAQQALEAMMATPPVPATHRIAYGEAPEQFVDLYLPPHPPAGERHPLIVAIHGGFWRAMYDLAHLSHACAALAATGVAVASLEYRRVGQGGGYPGTLQDATAGLDLVRSVADTHRLDTTRVILTGHSAGGQLAMWLGARRPIEGPVGYEPMQIAGIVGLAPLSDLVRGQAEQLGEGAIDTFLGGSPETAAAAYVEASPAAHLPLGVRQVIIHGEADDVVPVSLSEHYVHDARASGDSIELVVLPGADHFCVVNPFAAEWPVVVQHLRALIA